MISANNYMSTVLNLQTFRCTIKDVEFEFQHCTIVSQQFAEAVMDAEIIFIASNFWIYFAA